MKQTLTKSDKNSKILNKLIAHGLYTGYIAPEKFELAPKRFPNNHRIIGIINENGNYDLSFDLKPPLKIAGKIVCGLGMLIIIVSLLFGNWMLPVILIVFGLMAYLTFRQKGRKEINRLTDRILEFQKAKHE